MTSPRLTIRLARFVRSAGVGLVASLVDLAALALLVRWVGLEPVLANVPSLLMGLFVQFFGNKYFAFRDPSRALVRQGSKFALVEAGALGLNALSFHLVATFAVVPFALARLVCSGAVYVGYSFPLWGLVFRPSDARPRRAREP